MTRNHRKKKITNSIDNENVKLEDSPTSKAPKPGPLKDVATPLKSNKPTIAPKEQVGLLVTDELAKAMAECETKVDQIIKGCRAANRRFRC